MVVGVAGMACLWSRLAAVVAAPTTAVSENACVVGLVASNTRMVSSLRRKFVEAPAVLAVHRTIAGVPQVWSPVFVPEFVPVISEVKASVPAASLRVYIRAAVFVLVNELENVSATFRRSIVALLKVFAPVFVWAEARTISPAPQAEGVNASCSVLVAFCLKACKAHSTIFAIS